MIAHKVESGRDVILDGIIYKPDSEKLVYLPRIFETDEIVPLEPGDHPDDEGWAAKKNPLVKKKLTINMVPADDAPAADMTGADIGEALNG